MAENKIDLNTATDANRVSAAIGYFPFLFLIPILG
jgi:hypothetical protein